MCGAHALMMDGPARAAVARERRLEHEATHVMRALEGPLTRARALRRALGG